MKVGAVLLIEHISGTLIRNARTTGRMLAPLFLLFSLGLVSDVTSASSERQIDDPIEHQDGNFIIAAVFWIGEFVDAGPYNRTYPDGYCLNYTSFSFWGIQRALAFRRTIQEEILHFR